MFKEEDELKKFSCCGNRKLVGMKGSVFFHLTASVVLISRLI